MSLVTEFKAGSRQLRTLKAVIENNSEDDGNNDTPQRTIQIFRSRAESGMW